MEYDEKSYERYRRYRLNKYSYEREQIYFPVAVILILTAIISLWKYIIIAVIVACVVAIIALAIYWYRKKQVFGQQAIVLTEDQAREGVTANINLHYNANCIKLVLDVPPGVRDGQKFVVKNVVLENEKGKKVKKTLHLVIKIIRQQEKA